MIASLNEVDEFLESTEFKEYQSVPLPHGRRTPGRDLGDDADQVLGTRVKGKSVLDVGACYGFFSHDAVQRGATVVVGVEPDPERFKIATRISELNGGRYKMVQGRADSLNMEDRFDVVLFLNVLHHVDDPVATMRSLAARCKETLIVQFPPPDEPRFIFREMANGEPPSSSFLGRISRNVRRSMLTRALRFAGRRVPLIGIGTTPYFTFYFSPEAFEELFVKHAGLFSDVTFQRSAHGDRIMALCRIEKSDRECMDGGVVAEEVSNHE
jgi:SAM-dependent methyltransferase